MSAFLTRRRIFTTPLFTTQLFVIQINDTQITFTQITVAQLFVTQLGTKLAFIDIPHVSPSKNRN